MATCVKHTVVELVGSEVFAGVSDGVHFGVGGGVFIGDDTVVALADNFLFINYDTAERTACLQLQGCLGQVNCMSKVL